MRKIILLIYVFTLVLQFRVNAQQDFRTNYKFGSIKQESGLIKIYKDTLINTKINKKSTQLVQKYIPYNFGETGVKYDYSGIIKKRNEDQLIDTFFLKLWPIVINENNTPSQQKRLNEKSQIINNGKAKNKYIMVIEKWPVHHSHNSFDIPFSSTELSEITIPLRYNVKDQTVSDAFLNANISVSRIWGKTRFYESEFVKPRDRYIGLGGFGGLGITKNSEEKDEVGLLYGGNFLVSSFGVNLIVAIGGESAIGPKSKTTAFIGFGIGFDIFKLNGSKMSDE